MKNFDPNYIDVILVIAGVIAIYAFSYWYGYRK